MMKAVGIAALALTLAACAHKQPKEPEQVLVPISVPCESEQPNAPTLRFSPPYKNVYEAARDLLGDREMLLAYQHELEAAFKSCK